VPGMRIRQPGMSPENMAIAVAVTMAAMAGIGAMKNVTGTSSAVAIVAVSPGTAPTKSPNSDAASITQMLYGSKTRTKAWDQAGLGTAMVNSTIVAGTITLGTVLFSTLAGFAFAKLRFRFSSTLLLLTIGTMMIPPQLAVVPLYLWMADLGWSNQLQTVILPTLVSAFGTFFMRQYLVQALPTELIEAARVDGASSLRVVWHVVFPAARPAMAVLGLLTFVFAWNDFLWPIIALNQQNPTVQVALNALGTGYVPDQAVIMAGALLGTLPLLIAFILFGKQIVGGIMQGAIKG